MTVTQTSKAFLQIYLKLTTDKPVNICSVARQEQYGVTDTWSSTGLSLAEPAYGEWLMSSLQQDLFHVPGLLQTAFQTEGSLYMPSPFRT